VAAVVDRFTSRPIELPPPEEPFKRADLIFYGLDHSGPSFEGRVFMAAPRNLDRDADRDHPDYVGSFFIFGHGGCFGDVGHCDVPTERDPFDLRPPHPLEPAVRILTVTDAVRRLIQAGKDKAPVTIIIHTEPGEREDVLSFDTVRLATYA
jgi:hypothetical protein